MTRPIDIKYINPTAIKHVDSIVTDFEVLDKKFESLLLPIGCKTAEINFIIKLNITISKIGDKIVVMISKIPTRPIEFFINTELAKIKSIPSDKYPPITGT